MVTHWINLDNMLRTSKIGFFRSSTSILCKKVVIADNRVKIGTQKFRKNRFQKN